ncbi:methyl-accepting chemotaxis protein [Rhizobium sp. NFR07]|uniref:methyl-accepting chemotaxis protein n=1 Tax=Rhizobium sp. NFR07 TaxID=1566262 RepID=UPI0008EFBE41|nr:methyl-accepting chemotaxis protein [Rhizobium sp. NFR07]SFA82476.1 methyl-accepting chemotaxis protein [Rhizobium sp. NFR07]
MSFLKNTSIRSKILSVIIPLCVVGFGASSLLSFNYKAADADYTRFISTDNATAVDIGRANRALAATVYGANRVMFYQAGSPEFKAASEFYSSTATTLVKRLAGIRSALPGKGAELDAMIARVDELVALTNASLKFAADGNGEQAKVTLAQVDKLFVPLSKDIATFLDNVSAEIVDTSKTLTTNTDKTIVTSMATLSVVFVLGIIAALLIASKGITTPIARLRARMNALAEGDTEAAVEGQDRRDEVGQMAAAVAVFRTNAIERARLEREAGENRSLSERERTEREAERARETADIQFAVDQLAMALGRLADGDVAYRIDNPFAPHLDTLRTDFNGSVSNLNDTLRAVGNNARGIDAGASEIRTAADNLSKRTEQQAASVEETAAALEQITTTVKDASRRADEVGNLVARAREGAERSGQVVGSAVTAMNEIERSSAEITNIISVIDDIAFQTNLLALNAGVEAARAGDAGKGFAVVAQEVRELAQRSAQAAKEIKALINTSGEQVRVGVTLVDETGEALKVIVAEVQEINRHVAAIVESSREQATGLQEISNAVNTMDQGTQQNAAMVEESTAASHGLAREAAALNQLLSRFNLGEGTSVSVAPAMKPAPVSAASQPAVSPARALGRKLSNAFGAGSAAAVQPASWEDF